MSATTFDTLKFAERLEKAGLTRAQAVAIVETQKEALAEALDTTLATRSDLAALEKTVRADITDIKLEFARLDAKVDKLAWMMGILIAISIANFAKQFF
ncbi:MAG: DUF1640 domain-containing protein [Betaproteobacteria bacterium]|nr:DUF1640 domain-containing protein [Betaproteobacteria bacterium]